MDSIKRDVVEGIILNERNEILLQKKSADYPFIPGAKWMLFGGQIEQGESPKETFEREIKEELSCSLENIQLFKTKEYNIGDLINGRTHILKAVFKGEISKISLKEGFGFAFFSFSELDSLNILQESFETIKNFFLENKLIK